jgi:hypothetical protein
VPPPDVLALAYASPDRRYILYLVGPDSSNSQSALYSVALDTRTAARLTPPVPQGQKITPQFITADSRYAVFWVGTDTTANYYAAPLVGGEPVHLFGPITPYFSGPPYTTADSRSIFIRRQRSAGISTVYVIPIAGGPPRELVPDLPPNTSLDLLGVSADNQWAVVRTTATTANPGFTYTLSSLRMDGSGVPIELLSGSSQTCLLDDNVKISADAQSVVYTLRRAGDEARLLYGAPIAGGASLLLNVPPEASGPSIENTIYLSPDSRRVVFFGSDQGHGLMYDSLRSCHHFAIFPSHFVLAHFVKK